MARASALVSGAIQSSAVDAPIEGGGDVVDHRLDLRLRRGREVARHVQLAHGVADAGLLAEAHLLRRPHASTARFQRAASSGVPPSTLP